MHKLACIVPIRLLVEMDLDDQMKITDWTISQETIQAIADFMELVSQKVTDAAQQNSDNEAGDSFKVDISSVLTDLEEIDEADPLTNDEIEAAQEAQHKDSFFINPSKKVH